METEEGEHLILLSASFLPSSETGLEKWSEDLQADLDWEHRSSICKLLIGPFLVGNPVLNLFSLSGLVTIALAPLPLVSSSSN